MPTNEAPHQGKHVVVTVPAEVKFVVRVYPDGTLAVVQSLVVPDQLTRLTVERNTETDDFEAGEIALEWVSEHDWADLDVSANGVDLSDCAVCMVCGGCACEQSLAMSEVYPEGVPVCGEHVAEHYDRLAAETAEAEEKHREFVDRVSLPKVVRGAGRLTAQDVRDSLAERGER